MTAADQPSRIASEGVADRMRAALAGCAMGCPNTIRATLSLARHLAGDVDGGLPVDGPGPVGAHVALLGVPVGLAVGIEPIADLAGRAARHASSVDPTRLGLAAASAVAAATGAALDGAELSAMLGLVLAAADTAEDLGEVCAGPALSARLRWAVALATRADGDPMDVVDLLVGASGVIQEAVPAAFAVVALCWDDPAQAARAHELLDRLTCPDDAIAPIVTALLGARHGSDVVGPTDLAALVLAAPDVDRIVENLSATRSDLTEVPR